MRLVRNVFVFMVVVGAAAWGGLWLYDTFAGSSWLRSPERVSGRYIGEDTARRDKVIVFVHGVTGDEKATWTHRDKGSGQEAYWPALMRADEAYRDHDIYVVGYPTTYRQDAPTIVDLARGLNKRLTLDGILPHDDKGVDRKQGKEIIFVAHSMGNLIVRTAMMIDPRYNGDALQVPLLLSMASPSKGSALAKFAERWSRNPQYKAMVDIKDNPFLDILNTLWLHNPPLETEIACAYETRPMPDVPVVVVDRDSATAICTRPKPAALDANHESIAKPFNRDSEIYLWARREITRERRHAAASEPARWKERNIVIGGKDFLESNALAAIMAFMINPRFREGCAQPQQTPPAPQAGNECFKVDIRYHIGGRDRTFKALADEEIDLYAEYTGTLLMNFPDIKYTLSREEIHGNESHTAAGLNAKFLSKKNLRRFEFLDRFALDSAYQLIMRKAKAAELKLPEKDGRILLSDLAKRALGTDVRLTFSSTPDFFYRPDGVAGLREHYSITTDDRQAPFDFTAIRFAQHDHKYEALGNGDVDIVDAYLTDPELLLPGNERQFFELVDDKQFFPHYYAMPLVNRQLLQKYGSLRRSLAPLKGRITTAEIAGLIGDLKKAGIRSEDLKMPAQVAGAVNKKQELFEAMVRDFLLRLKLLPG